MKTLSIFNKRFICVEISQQGPQNKNIEVKSYVTCHYTKFYEILKKNSTKKIVAFMGKKND